MFTFEVVSDYVYEHRHRLMDQASGYEGRFFVDTKAELGFKLRLDKLLVNSTTIFVASSFDRPYALHYVRGTSIVYTTAATFVETARVLAGLLFTFEGPEFKRASAKVLSTAEDARLDSGPRRAVTLEWDLLRQIYAAWLEVGSPRDGRVVPIYISQFNPTWCHTLPSIATLFGLLNVPLCFAISAAPRRCYFVSIFDRNAPPGFVDVDRLDLIGLLVGDKAFHKVVTTKTFDPKIDPIIYVVSASGDELAAHLLAKAVSPFEEALL